MTTQVRNETPVSYAACPNCGDLSSDACPRCTAYGAHDGDCIHEGRCEDRIEYTDGSSRDSSDCRRPDGHGGLHADYDHAWEAETRVIVPLAVTVACSVCEDLYRSPSALDASSRCDRCRP